MSESNSERPSIVTGVEHGPWKANEGNVQQRMEWGMSEEEALAALDSYEKSRQIAISTGDTEPSGELKELHDAMADDYTKRVDEAVSRSEKDVA